MLCAVQSVGRQCVLPAGTGHLAGLVSRFVPGPAHCDPVSLVIVGPAVRILVVLAGCAASLPLGALSLLSAADVCSAHAEHACTWRLELESWPVTNERAAAIRIHPVSHSDRIKVCPCGSRKASDMSFERHRGSEVLCESRNF